MDVVTILLAVLITSIPSWFAIRNHRGISEIRNQNEAIKGQVINGHSDAPPLRADLDRAIAAVENLGHDVRGLRQDMAAIDDMRRQQIADLRADLDHRTGRRHP